MFKGFTGLVLPSLALGVLVLTLVGELVLLVEGEERGCPSGDLGLPTQLLSRSTSRVSR